MYDLDADELDAIELCMAIEEAFDIEIPDEEAEKFYNTNTTLETILDFILCKKGKINISKRKIFRFLNSKYIDEEILLKLLENDEITSNWEKISEFVKVVDQKSFTISEIAKYSFIFQNDFILSNVENLYKIVQFLENNKITVNEIISFINDGEIEKIEDEVKTLKKSIQEKQDLIREKQIEINTKKSEIQSLEKIIQNLDKEVGNLNEEIRVLQGELNEFL